MKKVCKSCNENKEISFFGVSKYRKDGTALFRTKCKECLAEEARNKRIKKPKINPYITKEGFKICSKCNIEKPFEDYPLHSYYNEKPIYRNRCKECQKKYLKEYGRINKVSLKEKNKTYREENKEKIKKLQKDYYLKNRENKEWVDKERKRKSEWKKSNPDKARKWEIENKETINERRRELYKENPATFRKRAVKWEKNNPEKKKKINSDYKKNNPEKINKYSREYAENNPLERLKRRIRSRTRGALNLRGWQKNTRTQETLKCSWEELKKHIEDNFKEGMSWENMELWDIDHIIPLAAAADKKELLALGHHKNLQPMWSSENYSKQDKYLEEDKVKFLKWYSEIYYL